MKIRTLKINEIGGIKNLELSFHEGLNVICGENGVGKTTILNVIADAFGYAVHSRLKRYALSREGSYDIEISVENNGDASTEKKHVKIADFEPSSSRTVMGWRQYAGYLINMGKNQELDYQKLKAISNDPERNPTVNSRLAVEGIPADGIKKWFVNRFLFADKPGSLTKEQNINFHLAKEVFHILDESVSFKTVNGSSLDILLSTTKGDIYYEYLSSGYKSSINIILGLIKEIEYRTAEAPKNAESFEGIILIDEVDLHLHPSWQGKLVNALKTILPKAQLIITTHSPHVLQTLDRNEIIPLTYDENGNTRLKELELGRFGLQGWTVEEILKYVMEIPDTESELYTETLKAYDEAMNREDKDEILRQYAALKEMLHPGNILNKLLDMQITEWED
ncbi:MAG: AAA family ATPase [Lachnospiraceae bacterium]|nr:AAA family ATPase [Lachnospiraceae bacterium]